MGESVGAVQVEPAAPAAGAAGCQSEHGLDVIRLRHQAKFEQRSPDHPGGKGRRKVPKGIGAQQRIRLFVREDV